MERKMNLKEIKKKCPDYFMYKGEEFKMVHYSLEATHKGQRSDLIIWENDNGTKVIEYDKGNIKYVGDF